MLQSPETLTTRQLEVLGLRAKGWYYAEIASELAISRQTVRQHLGHAISFFEVFSSSAAVFEAARRGILPLKELYDLTKASLLTPEQIRVMDNFTTARDNSDSAVAGYLEASGFKTSAIAVKKRIGQVCVILGVTRRPPAGLIYMAAQQDSLI